MNKRLHSHKKADSSASFPVRSQFQSRPFIAQAKLQSEKPLTQTETENQEFQQHKFEATKLKLQAKNGTITPEGQERLTVLQAKMSGTLQTRQEHTSCNCSNFTNIPISRSDAPSQQAVQTKLTIGEPEDKFEKEADQIADELDELLHAPVSQQADKNLQKEEMSVEEKEIRKKPMLQRRATVGGLTAPEGLETAINQARGGGKQLPKNVREPMEQYMGADFSYVRVHTGPEADQLNRALHSRAFFTGRDMFFGSGEYNPASREGKKLIFHEGTHAAQQNEGGVERKTLTQRMFMQKKERTISRASVCQSVVQRMNITNPVPADLDYTRAGRTTKCTMNVIGSNNPIPDMLFESGDGLHAEEKAIAKLQEYVDNGTLVPYTTKTRNEKMYTVVLSTSKSPCTSEGDNPTRTDGAPGCTEKIQDVRENGLNGPNGTVTFKVDIASTHPYHGRGVGGVQTSNAAYNALGQGGSSGGTFPYLRQ